MIPHKGTAAVQAGDIGDPHTLVLRQGSWRIPKEILVKKVGSPDWSRFNTSTGQVNSQGNLVTVSEDKPHPFPTNYDHLARKAALVDKQWGLEYLKSILPTTSYSTTCDIIQY